VDEPLKNLRKLIKPGQQELLALLEQAKGDIESRIKKGIDSVGTRRGRDATYKAIEARYEKLSSEITDWGISSTERTVEAVKKDVRGITGAGLGAEFSEDRFNEYYRFTKIPTKDGKMPKLAAQKTANMAAKDVQQLNAVVRETLVQHGLTGGNLQTQLKEAWGKQLGVGLDSWKFIDKSGRAWDSANYFNMLSRTLPSQVYRMAYKDSILDAEAELADFPGEFDLATIEGGGDPCPTCSRWRGVVVSANGLDPNFPSEADAVEAGVFHPNCVCSLVSINRELDKDTIKKQKDLPNPKEATKEEWNKYATEIKNRERGKVSTRGAVKALQDDKSDSARKGVATKKRKAD